MRNVERVVKVKHEKGAWTCYFENAFGETSSRTKGIKGSKIGYWQILVKV